jgi:transcriptional regulator with XRE-family HTH domain
MADKRGVTIRELAQAAGVSIGTVSRALKGQPGLSEQTRGQVLEVAQQLGYDVGKLRTGKPRRMLFLYSRHVGSLANNPFYSYVLHGAETACREAGVPLSLMSVQAGEDVAGLVRRHEADASCRSCWWTISTPACAASTTTTSSVPGWPPGTCWTAAPSVSRPSSGR